MTLTIIGKMNCSSSELIYDQSKIVLMIVDVTVDISYHTFSKTFSFFFFSFDHKVRHHALDEFVVPSTPCARGES